MLQYARVSYTMTKRSQLPASERPEAKALNGQLRRMSERDLLALVLGSGVSGGNVKQVATALLRKFGNDLLTCEAGDLCQIKGIGEIKAARMAAAFELYRRLSDGTALRQVKTPEDAYWVCQDLGTAPQEILGYLALDVRNRLLERVDLYKGSETLAVVDPKHVFRTALNKGAQSLIVYHNHPSGSPDPSAEDRDLARRLVEAGQLLNLPLLDFVIITKSGYYSLREHHTKNEGVSFAAEPGVQLSLADALLRAAPTRRAPDQSQPGLFTYLEFFAGIGLLRYALDRQGWTVKYANDIDPKKKEMYAAHFGAESNGYHEGDIHRIDPGDVPSATLATASFPCTDLSLAGARAGLGGKQSSAFWGFIRILDGMGQRRPPLVMIENVPGFLTSHGGGDFQKALLALNELGYEVDAFIIDALHFVPQSRKRLFVIGTLTGRLPDGDETVSLLSASELRPQMLMDYIGKHRDIRWRLRPLPSLPESTRRLESILEDLPDDAPQWWSRDRADYLLSQMSPLHREKADELIRGRKWSYGAVFRRIRKGKSMAELRCDGVAGCLRTPKGGSAKQILFKAGYGKHYARLLTPRECARLMGADDYRIAVKADQALFGFGDAVCVPVIEWIARHYLDPLVSELLRCGAEPEREAVAK